MNSIPFILDSTTAGTGQDTGDTKSILGNAARAGLTHVPVERLRDNLASLGEAVSQAFSSMARVGDFALDQITLQVQVSAEGGVALIGTAKVAGSGAITLTFKRADR